ncbi:zinc finger CCCH domain-containing protein 6-like [Populus alba x Populus x berolinensis]|nr:zinc finger CCCH domain-containing protein 6-like [Populus alba x Populus x berolinensis]
MKRSSKSNRVSWAPGLNLCQERLFVSEDCPSKVGGQVQDHLQKKASLLLLNSSGKEPNDFPPGFEGSHFLNPCKKELSCFTRIQWKCPPKFVVSSNWHVTAGEESQESQAQKLREMRALEAFYPRPSAVPPSPVVSLDVEDTDYDDSLTPIIPLIPVEEEEATELPSDLTEPLKTSQSPALPPFLLSSGTLNSSKCITPASNPLLSEKPAFGKLPNAGTNLISAASAAVTAIMKNKGHGSLIDTGLLVKILSDPKMIEELAGGNQPHPVTSRPVTSSMSPSCEKPDVVPAQFTANGNLQPLPSEEQPWSKQTCQIPISCPKPAMPLRSMPSNGSLYLQPSQMHPTVSRASMHQDTAPASGFGVFSSIHVPIPVPNSMPTTVSTVPRESIATQISFKDTGPHQMSNLVQSTLVVKPVQPNSVPHAGMKTNPVKDVEYIKNLIREHGTVKKEIQDRSMPHNGRHYNQTQNQELIQNIKKRESNHKSQKPCMYFKTPKGCRNGFNCPFQHDPSFQFQTGSALDAPVEKKMKFSGEIVGRT